MKSHIISSIVLLSVLITSPLMAQRRPGPGQGPGAEFMEWKLQKELGLSPEQVEKMKELRESNMAENAKIRDDRRELMMERRKLMTSRMEKNQAEMKKILTPEQYEKWRTMRFEQMERMMKESKDRPKRPQKRRHR